MPENENHHMDIFIPQTFMACLPVCVLGVFKKVDQDKFFLNCTHCFDYKTTTTKKILACARAVENMNRRSSQKNNNKFCLGVFYASSNSHNHISELKKLDCQFFVIAVEENTTSVTFFNWNETFDYNLVLYNSNEFYCAELLLPERADTFVNFLFQSCQTTEMVIQQTNMGHLEDWKSCVTPPKLPKIRQKLINGFIPVLTLLCYICDFLSKRIPVIFQNVLTVTTTGKQIACKYHHLKTILHDLSKEKRITLLSGNLLSALIVDSGFGLLVTCIFCDYLQPTTMVEIAISQTDVVVNHLQDLLFWLMGVPAGLKLNLPLNSALGRFFLYHIYLWKTYIVLIKPFLLVMLEFSMSFGVLGLSFLISLCTDLLSLATLHIYCFYGYAARIYSLKLSGLIAFWRLFRGKKWNPLRSRVDSFRYDVQQLFLGTLIFTVLVFLLPTVALYYAVFSMLRLVVLVLQIILCKIVDILTTFPLYATTLHSVGHPLVKGDINIKVTSAPRGISLSLEVISHSLSTVLQKTLPTRCFCIPLTFKNIVNKIILGEVVYPL